MKKILILNFFLILNFSNLTNLEAHSLPSHFVDHSHTDPKFERPNIRLRNQN